MLFARRQGYFRFHAVLGRGANLVFVSTLIKTGRGEPVFGLTANDFVLIDDGIERKISIEEKKWESAPGTGGRGADWRGGLAPPDSYRKLGPLLDAMVGAVAHRVAGSLAP